MASFMPKGDISPQTSILSGRLNIVQTDRQKGIIPPLPSHPHSPSKPSGSHSSVTTEEEDQRGKGALLLTNHSVTHRPPSPPRMAPLFLLLFISWSFGETLESRGVNQPQVSPSLSPKGRRMPRGRGFGIRVFVRLWGRAGPSPLGAAQGGIQSRVWRALQRTMAQPGDKVSPWWGICGEVQVSEVKSALSGLTHLSPAAPLPASDRLLHSCHPTDHIPPNEGFLKFENRHTQRFKGKPRMHGLIIHPTKPPPVSPDHWTLIKTLLVVLQTALALWVFFV